MSGVRFCVCGAPYLSMRCLMNAHLRGAEPAVTIDAWEVTTPDGIRWLYVANSSEPWRRATGHMPEETR